MFSRKASVTVTLLVVLLVTLGLVASALPVFAAGPAALPLHAQLVSTAPEDGASVQTAEQVTMTFSEDINPEFLQVRVQGPGADEADGAPEVDGTVVTQPLAADLPAGEHEVTFRVVSVDGHPVSGSFSFTTTVAGAGATPSATPTPTPTATPTDTPSPTATPSPSPSTVDATPTSSGAPGWLVPVGLAVLVVLLAGGGRARRPRGPPRRSRRPRRRGLRRISRAGRTADNVSARAPLAQLAEQLTLNQRVRGSSP